MNAQFIIKSANVEAIRFHYGKETVWTEYIQVDGMAQVTSRFFKVEGLHIEEILRDNSKPFELEIKVLQFA